MENSRRGSMKTKVITLLEDIKTKQNWSMFKNDERARIAMKTQVEVLESLLSNEEEK